jgi:hypothetical protein
MASWIGDDPNYMAAFAEAGKKVEPIDRALADGDDAYARGHVFWKWVEARGAVKAAAQATVLGRGGWRESLEHVLGIPWQEIVAVEHAWSAQEMERARPK